jgi:hypothetical protein
MLRTSGEFQIVRERCGDIVQGYRVQELWFSRFLLDEVKPVWCNRGPRFFQIADAAEYRDYLMSLRDKMTRDNTEFEVLG